MLKLFRDIRKKLAAENKIPAYLRYAIGEIVLVVIGILIAIQANNWNIEKSLQHEKEFALNKLIENLKQDTTYLKGTISSGRTYISALDSCLLILKNPKAYSNDKFTRLFSTIHYTLPFEYNQIAFNELSNSGKLKLIKNETLTDSLFHYYDDNFYKAVSEALNNFTRENVRSYTIEYDFMIMPINLDNHLKTEFNIKEKSLMDYSTNVRIINSIRFKIILLKELTERYDLLVKRASNLISLINNELNDN